MTRSRLLNRVALAAGWALAAAMSGVALVRLFRSQSQPQLIGLQGVGMWLLLPAAPLAVAAIVARQRSLAVVAIVLAVGNVLWIGELFESGTDRPAPAGAATVQVATANLLLTNSDIGALAAELVSSGAQVLLLQEVTPEHLRDLRAAGLLDSYPFQVLDPLPGFHGSVILSTLPIVNGRPIDVAGSPMTQADVITAAGPVRIVNVHAVAPLDESQARRWRAQLHLLGELAANSDVPLVMAGDFNATKDHAPLAALLDSGLRDAYTEAGTGFGATWPQWGGPAFPLMRLDHVLVSDTVTVMSAQVQQNPGSDHRRLAVELAVPSPDGPAPGGDGAVPLSTGPPP